MDMPRPPRVRKMLSFRSDLFLLKNDSKMNIAVTLPSCKELPSHFVEFNWLITYSWSNDCLPPSYRSMDKWLEFDQILVIGSHIGLHLTRHCTTYVQSIWSSWVYFWLIVSQKKGSAFSQILCDNIACSNIILHASIETLCSPKVSVWFIIVFVKVHLWILDRLVLDKLHSFSRSWEIWWVSLRKLRYF
jgi:hypothetical protein